MPLFKKKGRILIPTLALVASLVIAIPSSISASASAQAQSALPSQLKELKLGGQTQLAEGLDGEQAQAIVSSLSSLYEGDKTKAREQLQTLYEAGIVDENGNMVDLDVRQNGQKVDLMSLALYLAEGGVAGELTVNGEKVGAEQVLKLEVMREELEFANLLDQKVEITDKHVASLKLLVNSIAEGKTEFSKEAKALLQSVPKSALLTSVPDGSYLPKTATDVTGDLTVSENKFRAPYIDGASYDAAYGFDLINTDHQTFYTDDRYDGGADALPAPAVLPVVTVNYNPDNYYLTATLSEACDVPVSFDYKFGGQTSGTPAGTVTWTAGDTADKSIRVAPGTVSYMGSATGIVNFSNIKNATFEDGKTALSQNFVIPVASYDYTHLPYLIYRGENYQRTVYTKGDSSLGSGRWTDRTSRGSPFVVDAHTAWYAHVYTYDGIIDWFPKAGTAYSIDLDLGMNANSKVVILSLYAASGSGSEQLTQSFSGWRDGKFNWTGDLAASKITNLINSEGKVGFSVTIGQAEEENKAFTPTVNSIKVRYFDVPTQVTGTVSVAPAVYRVGETIPVNVNFNRPVVADKNSKIKINGTWYPILDIGDANVHSPTISFAYPVKAGDPAQFSISEVSGLKNYYGDAVDVTALEHTSIGANDGVCLSTGARTSAFDLENTKWGVDDVNVNPTFTAIVPIKSAAEKQWITDEAVECTDSGRGIDMTLPTYGAVELKYYLRNAYFSYDEGMIRYPAYIVTSGTEETPVAIATRYTVPQNLAPYVRRDTVNLYLPDYALKSDEKALPDWSEALTDANGYKYFVCGTETTGDGTEYTFTPDANYVSVPALKDAGFRYYVRDVVGFVPGAYVTRTQHYELAESGYIKLDDGNYVILQDPEHPEYQYDVEAVVNEELYQTLTRGYARQEGQEGLTLSYQISNRASFTFADPKDFEWYSLDESKVKVVTDPLTGQGELSILGTSKTPVKVGLRVLNGAQSGEFDYRTYEMDLPEFSIAEGKDPFLIIPATSADRTTLTNTATDILFTTNLTERNILASHSSTTYTLNLYRLESPKGEIPDGASPVWTGKVYGTASKPAGHITIPADALSENGYYAAVVSAIWYQGEITAGSAATVPFSATAYLTVKQGPAKVTLNPLTSYTVMDNAVPEITYSVNPDTANVMYTIQKSGEMVGEKQDCTDGVIPFAPAAPLGLKDSYVITVYARNSSSEPWSVDSLSLTIYNHGALDLIVNDVVKGEIGGTTGGTGTPVDDTTITMSNAEKVVAYLKANGYELEFDDFNALRTDISLQKIVSVNYGSGLWGALSDKMEWSSSDPEALGINYAEGGYYADLNVYTYTSYSPYTDFLMVGKDDAEKVTVTAVHAATGLQASFDVNVQTLKGKLFLFQFFPKIATTVHYTNNDGVERTVVTDDQGRLAVYEPSGIRGTVTGYSNKDGEVYVGTFLNSELLSGEADIATLKLYPCNNIRLRAVSSVQLTFLGADNQPYNGEVILRGGVYKNGIFCPEATIRVVKDSATGLDGRQDIVASVVNGKLNLWFDPTQFKNSDYPSDFAPGDKLSYVFEYRFADTYLPGYVILHTVHDSQGGARATDSLIQLKTLRGAADSPQITAQTLQQYHGETHIPNAYTRNVIDFNENIGISKEFDMARLYTDIALLGEEVGLDGDGNRIYSGTNILTFAICDSSGTPLVGQSAAKEAADRIFRLADLDNSEFFIFPFSAVPFLRSTYLMDDTNLSASGIDGYLSTARGLKATYTRGNVVARVENLPYGIANLIDLPDIKSDASSENGIAKEIKSTLENSLNLGEAFDGIDTDAFVRNGMVFLGGMQTGGSKYAPHLVILPTANPEVFKIIAFIGANQRPGDGGDGFSVNYDPDKLSEDLESFKKALDEMGDSKKEGGDSSGEGSLDFNFYGAIQLQTQWNSSENRWDISFTGGNVGGNIVGKYEWSYQMMCGPYPFLFTLELGFHVDAELAFANKDGARAMLLDAAFGISIEAFAGLGFDLSLVSFQLGIFGSINADFNFLWLSDGNKTGSSLTIKGEIGIRMKVKLLFVTYSQTFASLPFNIASQKWGQYDQIKAQWEQLGYAELSGQTRLGRSYRLLAFPDGTAMAIIEGGAELESRDYLDLNERFWYAGGLLRKSAGPVTTIQGNAYPYANPVLSEDGSLFVYLSDNDVSSTVQSSASYAVNNAGTYVNQGKIDPDDEIAADSGLTVSGYGSNIFATWVRQFESPEKESKARVTEDDLGMMLNASEIYGATFNGTEWTSVRLTSNANADLSPVVASSGDKAIIAWRSLDASTAPKSGADLSSLFDVENNILYRIYDHGVWQDAVVAYNGSAGTVNALDVAMLSDGTALISYTVRTGEADSSTETFFTLIGTSGAPLTTGRLTNDDASDVNAQVTVLSDGFLVGWYSEHDAGMYSGKVVKSHDIRLAHIYANGSVDSAFLESVGGDYTSSYTSNFTFSAPSGNTDLSKISLVWSHKDESVEEGDEGKYDIEAMRFYQKASSVSLTSPMNVVETGKNVTIEHFASYTDDEGKIYVIFLDSDYSSVENVDYFDTIDLSGSAYYTAETANAILAAEPVCSIRLASAYYEDVSISATVEASLREFALGLDLPVQFKVTNTGTATIKSIDIAYGTTHEPQTVNLLPGASTTLGINYPIPEADIKDVLFTLTPEGGDPLTSGNPVNATLLLNRPDIGIASMKVTREANMERDVQLILANASGIPLVGSGKTVKLGFYKDSKHTDLLGEVVTIDSALYADIDQGIATINKTFQINDLMSASATGAYLYAHAWIEDVEEVYPYDNDASVVIRKLSAKSGGETFTVDHSLKDNGDGSYTVYFDIRNNAASQQPIFYMVSLYDEHDALVGMKTLSEETLVFEAEEIRHIELLFQAEELTGTPVSVQYSKSYIIWLDYQGLGYIPADFIYTKDVRHFLLTDENGKLSALPQAEPNTSHLRGWFTEKLGKGDFVSDELVFTEETTIYACLSDHDHNYSFAQDGYSIVATCDAANHNPAWPNVITVNMPTLLHEDGDGDANAHISGRIDEIEKPVFVYKQGDSILPEAPTTHGDYTVNITVGGHDYSWAYTITLPQARVVTAPVADIATEDGSSHALLTAGTSEFGTMVYGLSENAKTLPTSWSEAIPQATEANPYFVWYKVVAADASHIDSDPTLLRCWIYAPKGDLIKYVDYAYENGELVRSVQEVQDYEVLSESYHPNDWSGKFLVVKEDLVLNGDFRVQNGSVTRLVICDGVTLTINGQIIVYTEHNWDDTSTTFYVYSQAGRAGKLIVNGGSSTYGVNVSTSFFHLSCDAEISGKDHTNPGLHVEVDGNGRNSGFISYDSNVLFTGVQLDTNGELRSYGGEVTTGVVELLNTKAAWVSYQSDIHASEITVSGSNTAISIHGGTFAVAGSVTVNNDGSMDFNVYDGEVYIYQGIIFNANRLNSFIYVYDGLLAIKGDESAINVTRSGRSAMKVYVLGGILYADSNKTTIVHADIHVSKGIAYLSYRDVLQTNSQLLGKLVDNNPTKFAADVGDFITKGQKLVTYEGNATGSGIHYVGFDSSLDILGNDKVIYDYVAIKSNNKPTTWTNNTWYVVTADVTYTARITVQGNVHLILQDGVTLNANKGIHLTGAASTYGVASLSIYGQEKCTGVLNATNNGDEHPAIGRQDYNYDSVSLLIHGGRINAAGSSSDYYNSIRVSIFVVYDGLTKTMKTPTNLYDKRCAVFGEGIRYYGGEDSSLDFSHPLPRDNVGAAFYYEYVMIKGTSVHAHVFQYTKDGNTFIATCSEPRCDLPDNQCVFTPSMQSVQYNGAAHLLDTSAWVGKALYIAYFRTNTEGAVDSPQSVTAPINAGYYFVKVGYDESDTVNCFFTIAPRAIEATIVAKSSAYGDAPVTLTATTAAGAIVSGDKNVYSLSTTATAQSSVGTYDIVGQTLNPNYTITFLNGANAYTITKRSITVTITNKTSVYGSAPVALEATTPAGAIVNGDQNVYSLACEVTALSPVGTYDIKGTGLNDNYDITFANETNAYSVTKKALTVTANAKGIVYGDAPSNSGVSFVGFVNGEDQAVLGGTLAFAYTYEQFGHVTDGDHVYTITPSGYTSGNYEITFVEGVLTVTPKKIDVTIVSKASDYGSTQVALEATTEPGAIVNGDKDIFSLACEVTALSPVGTYNIMGTDLSDNYEITFKNEADAYRVNKKALVVTANAKGIVYGDLPANSGVSFEGFVNGEDQAVLGGTLAFAYDYEQFGHVTDGDHVYTITPSGYTADNYIITFEPGVLTVAAKKITVTIVSKTSVYGSAQVALEATTEPGAIVNGDEGLYSLACTVSELSPVGAYDILGSDLADNYDITFANEKDAYTVTKKALTVTANDHSIAYGDAPSNSDVSFSGFVNDEDRTVLGGTLAFAYTYEQFGHVTDADHAYIITPSGYTSGNYEITFVEGVLTVMPKKIDVTIVNKTSIYGEAQVALEATTEPGAIVNDDKDVYSLTCEVTALSPVGTYDITGTDLSDNYEITFKNEADAYRVTKKALTVTANPHSIIYGDAPSNDDVSFVGFVNGEDQAVLGGTLAFAYTYEQFGHVSDDDHIYAITPSGYTSENYEIEFVDSILTVTPKKIDVTIVNKTSIYGEAQVALEATTEPGAVVNGDKGLYSLACVVDAKSNVGAYDIIGTDLADNYVITFVNESGAYTVTKRPIVATAQDETIKYGESLPTFHFELSETVASEVLEELKGKVAFSCAGDPFVPGKYPIEMSFKDGYKTDTVLMNYAVTLVKGDLYILAKTLVDDDTDTGVEIELENADDAFAYGVSVEIQVVDTTATQDPTLDYSVISQTFVDRRSEMTNVVSIKLYQTVVVDGQEVVKEIQPSDLKEGLTILIKMEIPEYLTGRNFRILHIHSADEIEYVPEANTVIENGYVTVKVNRLSEFAFVHLKANEEMNHVSFCLGWLLFILDCLVLGLLGVYFALKGRKPLALIGLIAASAVLAYAIVAICLHLCIITIISLVLAVLSFAAWLTFFILNKKKGWPSGSDQIEKAEQPVSSEAVTESAEKPEAVTESAEEPKETSLISEEPEEKVVVDARGNYLNIRYNRSFTAKLIQSPDETKKYYEELKNEALSYKKTTSRVSWDYDSINSGRNKALKFAIRGKTLCVYLALNADDYAESKYKVEKAESKKYEEVPCLYRIKNDRRLGYAKDLIAVVMASLGLEKGEEQHEVYADLPYEPNKPLIERGLIKEVRTAATAEQIERAQAEGSIVAEEPEEKVVMDATGNYLNIRYNRSFLAKLIQSGDEAKAYYGELKNEVLSYKGTNSRISWSFDSINAGRSYVAKFGVRGKTLCLYLPLNPETLDPKYKVERMESKKYEDVPCLYRIKNDRRLGYAKELIALACASLTKGEPKAEDYYMPYEPTQPLLERGLIKEVRTAATAEQIERAQAEGSIVAEEPEEKVVMDAKGNYLNIRYNRSFTAKLIQSGDEAKAYYGELKNEILSYKGTNSRISWSFDSINAGRSYVAKFGVRGKTLCLYLPLDPESLDPKYKVERMESKKYEDVPCLYRIKNERRLRYAKELIALACASLTKGEPKAEDYYMPYEPTQPLLERGLIKEVRTAATAEQIERAQAEGSIAVVKSVSAAEVDNLMSDEVASAAIVENSGGRSSGKKGTINVDDLSASFQDGDTVNLKALKDKKLIKDDIKQVKLLARGQLDKKLHVELQDYSIEAVKMILATGGTVKKVE